MTRTVKSEVTCTHFMPYEGFELLPHPARYTSQVIGGDGGQSVLVRYDYPLCTFCLARLTLDTAIWTDNAEDVSPYFAVCDTCTKHLNKRKARRVI